MAQLSTAVWIVGLATSAACAPAIQGPATPHERAGTSWRLGFQGSDGTTLTPDDRKYTVALSADGQAAARID